MSMPDFERIAAGATTRRLAIVLTVFVSLGATGCEVPEAPTWDVDLTIPVVHEVHTLEDLIEGENNLVVDSLGTVALAVEETLERVTVGDELSVEPFTDAVSYELGPLEIDPPAPVGEAFVFSDLWPPAATFDGQYHHVMSFTFSASSSLPPLDSFERATLDQAACEVEIGNGLPVAFESVTLSFFNQDSGATVGTVTFDAGVPAGQARVEPLDLAGAELEADLRVEVSGLSEDSGEPVYIEAGAELEVDVRFLPPVTVLSAVTTVAPQSIVESTSISLGNGVHAGSAHFLDGELEVEVDNATELAVQLELVLPEFTGAADDPLRGSLTLPAGSSGVVRFPLAGVRFAPEQTGRSQVSARMEVDSQGLPVEVEATDQLLSEVRLATAAAIESFTGVLEPTAVEIEPTLTPIDLPDGLDQVSFAAASLVLEVDNAVGFPVDLDLVISGTDATRGTVALPVQERIAAAAAAPRRTTIVLDEQNSNIVALMNLMPSSLEVAGTATVGDGVTAGAVQRGDHLDGIVRLSAPLEVELAADRVRGDPSELELGDETRGRIRDDVSGGQLAADIANHLPTGGTVHLIVARSADAVGDPEPDAPGPLVLSGAMAAPQITGGRVEAAATTQLVFDLSKEDLRVFEQSPTFTGIVLDVEGTGGQTVSFLASDWVEVRAVATLRTRVDLE